MSLRINPEELVPKPGARERIFVEAPKLFEASKNIQCLPVDHVEQWLRTACPLPASRGNKSIVLLTEVCRKHGISLEQMRSRRRMKFLVQARKEATYVLRINQPHLSMNAIARLVGYNDHTTVYHHILDYSKRIGAPYPGSALRAPLKRDQVAA